MNLRLDVVISDITGKTGLNIITAILEGERSGNKLAQLADPRCKKPKSEIAASLQGNWSEEYLYELKDCYELYRIIQEQIQKCDSKIECLLEEFTRNSVVSPTPSKLTYKQLKGKNQPRIDLPCFSYRYYGVDLFAIEGVSSGTILTPLSEISHDIFKFNSAKQFTSYLRLAPNNRISGGKIISSRTPKGANRMALALRNAANTIEQKKDGHLCLFFKRIAYKKGRGGSNYGNSQEIRRNNLEHDHQTGRIQPNRHN